MSDLNFVLLSLKSRFSSTILAVLLTTFGISISIILVQFENHIKNRLNNDGKKIDKMRTLPRVVANTKVGKNVKVKIWRNKKLISKNLKLGRLESSEEFKEKKSQQKKTEELEIEKLKITVRDLNEEDISSRKLKITKGVVITEISNKSPLKGELNINDIIIEVKRTPITKSSDLKEVIEKITKQGDKNLLLSIIDNNNRRRYIGIKLN